jgi:hypothetical protein
MRTKKPGWKLSDKLQEQALLGLRDIRTTAQLVTHSSQEKRLFAQRTFDANRLTKPAELYAAKTQSQEERQRVECFRSFLAFATKTRIGNVQWASLAARLQRIRPSDKTLEFAAHLAGVEVDKKTMIVPIGPEATSEGAAAVGNCLLVDWHKKIDDHRQIVLGQNPRPGLFPAVFVYSDDLKCWYPQLDVIQLDKPGGMAWVCHCRFGNPHGIGHQSDQVTNIFPWHGEIRAYALSVKPDPPPPAVLTGAQLDEWVHRHLPFCPPEKLTVLRDEPPIVSIEIRSGKDTKGKGKKGKGKKGTKDTREWSLRPPEYVGTFPLDLHWRARHTFHLEIRKAPADDIAFEGDFLEQNGRMRILENDSTVKVPDGFKRVALPGYGLYRLRYWGERKPFLDQELEVWLRIRAEK